MKVLDFIKDRFIVLTLNIIAFVSIAAIMLLINIKFEIIFIVFCLWFIPLISYMISEIIKCKSYYNKLEKTLKRIDKKYLIPEIIEEANFLEGKIFNDILIDISKDMHENVKYYRDMQSEYREYIETWVHEIKTPIASTKLIIENHPNEITDKIDLQLDRIEGFVEQVLYYSRSNEVGKDYVIKETNLSEVVRNVLKRNYRDFINKKIKLYIGNIDEKIFSDKKWLEFIINQIIGNSIKYSKELNPIIKVYCTKAPNSIVLTIEDNGVGICERDLNRIFDKGFTGENGRIFGKSTGMGLYLCDKLCFKLGMKINIASKASKGTKINLIIPLSNMINKL